MSAANVSPYLYFGGRCNEALAFYETAIDAEVVMLMRFNESPEPVPPELLPENYGDKVMHVTFRVGDTTVLASDGCGERSDFKGFSLALSVSTEAEAERYFNALADGSEIKMPLEKTFWSPKYGMVTDTFGVEWMVMVTAHE